MSHHHHHDAEELCTECTTELLPGQFGLCDLCRARRADEDESTASSDGTQSDVQAK